MGEACQAFFRDADGDSLPDYLDSCRYPDEELPEGAAFVPCDELGRRDSDGDGVANDDDIRWRVPNLRQDPAFAWRTSTATACPTTGDNWPRALTPIRSRPPSGSARPAPIPL
ncbi:MAG: hypothetical protein R3F43_01275 [bacterium]